MQDVKKNLVLLATIGNVPTIYYVNNFHFWVKYPL